VKDENFSKELDVSQFPTEFQQYAQEEAQLVRQVVTGSESLLDAGCGEGRTIPLLAPLVAKYTGIDIDPARLELAQSYFVKYPNVTLCQLDARSLSDRFGKNAFYHSISLFNTLGCIEEPALALKNMADVTTKHLFFTVMKKGLLPLREKYYQTLNIPYTIDQTSETIFSQVWSAGVRSYSRNELELLAKKAGICIADLGTLANLAYYVIARRAE
jgi:ubiquinone/menaquinone biosynthesis C-methylase UbiE